MTDHQQMASRLREIFAANRVITEENFTLFHSGGKGADYVDVDTILSDIHGREEFVEAIVEKLEEDVDLEKHGAVAFLDKAFGPVGLLPYTSEIANRIGKQAVILRLDDRIRHGEVKVKGIRHDRSLDGESVLLLDDVVTTGNTQRNAIKLIEQETGARVKSLLTVYARDEEDISDITDETDVEYADSLLTFLDSLDMGLVLSDDPDDYVVEGFADRIQQLYGLSDEEVEEFVGELEEDADNALRGAVERILAREGLADEREMEEAVNRVVSQFDEEFREKLKLYLHTGRRYINQPNAADD